MSKTKNSFSLCKWCLFPAHCRLSHHTFYNTHTDMKVSITELFYWNILIYYYAWTDLSDSIQHLDGLGVQPCWKVPGDILPIKHSIPCACISVSHFHDLKFLGGAQHQQLIWAQTACGPAHTALKLLSPPLVSRQPLDALPLSLWLRDQSSLEPIS